MHSVQAMKDARVFVVGGAGFVGSNLVKKLLALGAGKVLVIDNLLSAQRENLPLEDERLVFVEGSAADPAVLKALEDEYDYGYHLACFHGNQNSMADPIADHDNNTLPTLMLCERIKDFKTLKKIVYSSAGCTVAKKTYEDAEATTEDAPVSLYLDSPYQFSKIFGEFYFNYYHGRYGVPVVKVRFQNVYGPGEVLGAGVWRGTPSTVWRNVTPTFIYRALKGMPLTVENKGIATRDFIYVDDIVAGLILAALNGEAAGVYNLASGVETSISDLANTIIALAGSGEIQFMPERPWDHSGKRFGSTEKSRKELGFQAEVPIREGLERTVKWTRENLSFIEQNMEKHKAHYRPQA